MRSVRPLELKLCELKKESNFDDFYFFPSFLRLYELFNRGSYRPPKVLKLFVLTQRFQICVCVNCVKTFDATRLLSVAVSWKDQKDFFNFINHRPILRQIFRFFSFFAIGLKFVSLLLTILKWCERFLLVKNSANKR